MNKKKTITKFCDEKLENLIKEFHVNGFTVIKKNLTIKNEIIENLRKEIDSLFQIEDWRGGWEGKEEYMQENKLLNKGARRLSNLINKSDIFMELIAIEIIQNFCELIFKDGYHIGGIDAREPLKNCGEQSLHQDWFPNDKNPLKVENMIGFVFLDKANKFNGTLRVVPKTHTKKV